MTTKIEWAEEWRLVPGYVDYLVSSGGEIKSLKQTVPKILRGVSSQTKHLYVFLYDGHGNSEKTWIHRAVLLAFRGEPESGQESRHLDGDPTNNEIDNLVWGTRKENSEDRRIHGTMPIPHESQFTKLTPQDIREIRKLHIQGLSSRTIGVQFSTSHTTVQKIVRGERWKGY